MTIAERRYRERVARRDLITATARSIAEREGWDAVTTRRLSMAIDYSQPVIYKHFASMDKLMEAVALEGFVELSEALIEAQLDAAERDVIEAVARAYIGFASRNPALYDAMFTRTSQLKFGADVSPEPLQTAFQALSDAVTRIADQRDVDTLTEVLWAALHGLTTLSQTSRLRSTHTAERITLLVAQFGGERRRAAGESGQDDSCSSLG